MLGRHTDATLINGGIFLFVSGYMNFEFWNLRFMIWKDYHSMITVSLLCYGEIPLKCHITINEVPYLVGMDAHLKDHVPFPVGVILKLPLFVSFLENDGDIESPVHRGNS